MFVASVPNRSSPPTFLLRESYRQGGKVKSRTLANVSHLPPAKIEALRQALSGSAPPASSPLALPDSFQIVRSSPCGHVAAVLGSIRKLGLESLIDPRPSRQRDLVAAMVAARIVAPAPKLATARNLHADTLLNSLGEMLGVASAGEVELYKAMDWLLPRQAAIETGLAKRHLSNGGLVLYDLTSTYFEGRHCPLAKLGHSRDDKSGKLRIVFGLLANADGCPVAVEVFEGNTADPKTVAPQVDKLRKRFGLSDVVLVGDRGMITSARIRDDLPAKPGLAGMEWISSLRANQIQKLARDGAVQMSLFDKTDLVEISHPDFPGERLVACHNPLLAERRARKRSELLAATEKQLDKIAAATRRARRPLRGKQDIGLRAGRTVDRYKVAKHFKLTIAEDSFTYERKAGNIEREEGLDGIYVVRTSLKAEAMPAARVVASYKALAGVEEAFRCLKTVDLLVRPIHHRLPDRVRAHVLLCMLAYYVEWHMRKLLAPILFDDDDPDGARAARASVVAPAQRSPSAMAKARTRKTADGLRVHSFQTLPGDLATIVNNRIQPVDAALPAFNMITRPTPQQQRALDLLGVTIRPD